jgi:hypothetical protein
LGRREETRRADREGTFTVQNRAARIALALAFLGGLACDNGSPTDTNDPVEVLEGQLVHGETVVQALALGDGDVARIELTDLEVVQGSIVGFVLRIGVGVGRQTEAGCGNTASRSMGIGDEWVALLSSDSHCLNLAMPSAYAEDVIIDYTLTIFRSL